MPVFLISRINQVSTTMNRSQIPPPATNPRQRWGLLMMMMLSTSPLAADDWNQYGGPQRSFCLSTQAAHAVPEQPGLQRQWQVTLGTGKSAIVGDRETVFVTYRRALDDAAEDTRYAEVTAALSASTGDTLWTHETECADLPEQEAFSGDPRAPQATPALHASYVVTLGFTGRLECLLRASGKVCWQIDLVGTYDCPPVQFGFAASPLIEGDRVYVLAGGRQAGLLCLDIATGKPIWHLPCSEASYATPVIADLDGQRQIVFMDRDELQAADLDGQRLWVYELPEQGMTNVPTPLPIGPRTLLLSGQGIKGIRCLEVKRGDATWEARERWFTGHTQFFYSNWVPLGPDAIIGCNENVAVAVAISDGRRLGRWRRFGDGNFIRAGDRLLVLDGRGNFSSVNIGPQQLTEAWRVRLLDARCWTPPTIIDQRLFVRADDQVACWQLNASDGARNELKRPYALPLNGKSHQLAGQASSRPTVDPVEQIATKFERDGEQAALELYERLRQTPVVGLTLDQRLELAALAADHGQDEFAFLVLTHAVEQFPDAEDARSALREIQDRRPSQDP